MQLRVDPQGRAYSTLTDPVPFVAVAEPALPTETMPKGDADDSIKLSETNGTARKQDDATVLPLSRRHLEMFTRMSGPSFRTTIRTDTVSTMLEQDTELDYENMEDAGLLIGAEGVKRGMKGCKMLDGYICLQ